MKQSKWAGMTLAVCACAGLVVFSMQQSGGSVSRFIAQATSNETTQGGTLHVPADLSIETPQPFAMDAQMARRAVRDGALNVELADGTQYPVRIERNYTDKSGHWNVVGRTDTKLGPSPMVLTFGAGAVFGTLPTPDGQMLRITTGPGRKVAIAPIGGALPRNLRDASLANDAITPPLPALAVPKIDDKAVASVAGKRPSKSSAAQKERIASSATTRNIAAAPVDTTPVDIDVLALYTPEQLTLRGDVETVETELANAFALATQAHIDSGSRVRLVMIDAVEYASNPDNYNDSALYEFLNIVPDVVAQRGDLTVLVRPHKEFDNCGTAFVTSQGHARTNAYSDFGYSVVNIDGECSPYNLAHETGHNMGAMHDRASDTSTDGSTRQGAYYFSYALRTPEFGTLMANRYFSTWVPYFSNPDLAICNGGPCGVADYEDDVRSFNLIAPAIAAFDGDAGFVEIADSEVLEPFMRSRYVTLPIRLHNGVAPAGGLLFNVAVVGGTATAGVDYEMSTPEVTISEGQTQALLAVLLYEDPYDQDSGAGLEETIELQITPTGDFTQVARDTATLTIVEPERRNVAMLFRMPPGVSLNDEIWLRVYGADDSGSDFTIPVQPPGLGFEVTVPVGAEVHLFPTIPKPYVLWPAEQVIPEVRKDVEHVMFPELGVRIAGTVRAEDGMTLPTEPFWLGTIEFDDQRSVYGNIQVSPPDYTFETYVTPRHELRVEANVPGFNYYVDSHYNVLTDVTRDIVLGTKPVLRAASNSTSPGQTTYMVGYLEGPAPAGGVHFRCRTIDRSAKAGSDYVALEGFGEIPEGESGYGYCGLVTTLPNGANELQERFEFVIDQVTGATLSTPSAPIVIYGEKLRTGGPSQVSAAE